MALKRWTVSGLETRGQENQQLPDSSAGLGTGLGGVTKSTSQPHLLPHSATDPQDLQPASQCAGYSEEVAFPVTPRRRSAAGTG